MSAREAFLDTMAALLERQGYHATGLSQIVAESGAPKGSLYHYFPDGKEGLAAEVVARQGRVIAGRIRAALAEVEDPVDAIDAFVRRIAGYVEATDCRGGGPLATVALETAARSDRLRTACDAAYRSWQAEFAAKLRTGGYPPERAASLALVIVAAIEGATILCRTSASATPMRQIADQLRLLLEASRR
jgi:TetR/AcrR family transcriptional repressor of lmrAB and yxaGH operons